MAKLEDLTRGAAVKGILPDSLVTVVDVKWYGSAAIELTYKDPSGKPNVLLLYRDREPTLDVVDTGSPWSFDGDGKLDVITSNGPSISIFIGNGDGTFQATSPLTITIPSTTQGIATGDLIGDGKVDFVVTSI